MSDWTSEFLPAMHLPYAVIAFRLAGAALLAALIGLERELRHRAAGLRTHMLVSLAACSFAIIAVEIVNDEAFSGDQVRTDPTRVVEAVTSGVAFLAAGFIVFAKGAVRGLTTAAGMWVAAGIGLAVGFGFWPIGLFAFIIGMIVIAALRGIETRFGARKSHRDGEPS